MDLIISSIAVAQALPAQARMAVIFVHHILAVVRAVQVVVAAAAVAQTLDVQAVAAAAVVAIKVG